MNRLRIKVTLLLATGAFFASCSKPIDEPASGEGFVKTTLTADNSVAIVQIGSKAAEPTLTQADFKVRLENTKAEVLREWDSYNDMPNPLKMVLGSYKLVAWYGNGNLPAFDQPYYEGVSKFTVANGETVNAQLECTLAATKVNVTFKENFKKEYTNYSIDLKTTTVEGEVLNFIANDTRDGYFKPGTLRMKLNLEKVDGTAVNFYPSPITVRAKEFIHLYFDVKNNAGSSTIVISTDESTNDIIEEIELPNGVLPKPAPDVKATGFAFDGTIETSEGVSKQTSISALAKGGIKKFEIIHNSSTWTSAGIPAVVDLVKADQTTKNKLKALGLTWSDELNKTEDEINACKTAVYVNMNDMIKLLTTPTEENDVHEFEFVVTDMFNQVNEQGSFTVTVAPPVYTLATPTEGNVFASRAYFEIAYTTEIENLKPSIEYKKAGAGSWTKANTEIVSATDGDVKFYVTGLENNTQYTFRAVMAAHAKAQEHTFTTETPAQVPNASMEEWYNAKNKSWRYYPWTNGGSSYWNTNNLRTTNHQGTFTYGYNSFPAVSYVNDAHSGGRAAEIRSTGTRYGNTITLCYDDCKVPGYLFMGDYSFDGTNDKFTYGRPFTVRPDKLEFWYKYKPYNNDEFEAYIEVQHREGETTTVLGTGVFRLRPGAEITTYTKAQASVTYTNFTKRATHMYIQFRSTTKNTPVDVQKVTGFNLQDGESNWTTYMGSILKVDDINLIY